mgnify:CR=1 FL=1
MSCANKNNGCIGIPNKGSILCEKCLEERKKVLKNRQEHNIEELLEKNHNLQEDNTTLKNLVKTLRDTITTQEKKVSEMGNKVSELGNKINELSSEIEIKNQTISDLETTIIELNEKKPKIDLTYNKHLEQENERLIQSLDKKRNECDSLVKDKYTYESTHEQLKIDSEKLKIENNRLNLVIQDLSERIKFLTRDEVKGDVKNMEKPERPEKLERPKDLKKGKSQVEKTTLKKY